MSNTGCDLSPAETDEVFKRFWKQDTARSEGARHCGLGLALCQEIVERSGGAIGANIDNGLFVLELKLPYTTAEG